MKHARKLASLLLALVMVFALATTAFAAGNSITVKDAIAGQKYRLYKMLDLEVSTDLDAYSYKVNGGWADFFKAAEGDTPAGKGLSYVEIDDQGYVTWKADADVAAFAKDAEEFAQITFESADKGFVPTADGDFTWNDLKAGYYLVTSSLGTKAIVVTTPGNPNPAIKEKNGVPSNEKKVEEDSKVGGDDAWGSKNDADIGQTVKFKSTITAQAGAENYVFHDKMSDGLTFNDVTRITLNGNAVDASNYTLVTEKANESDDDVTKAGKITDGDTFEVRFTQAFCDTLVPNDKIVISYTAILNENAVIAGAGNPNESKLSYGDKGDASHTPSGTTPPSETKTYTWQMKVFKYTGNDENKTGLAGAKFKLSKSSEETASSIPLVALPNNVYRMVTKDDPSTSRVNRITTDATGKFTIQGLDADTYYLIETDAPAGYNKLEEPVTIVIGENGVVNATDEAPQGVSEVEVLNQSGALLPSTGGMGTTVFYVLGAVLVVGSGVLLVTKKRMSRNEG